MICWHFNVGKTGFLLPGKEPCFPQPYSHSTYSGFLSPFGVKFLYYAVSISCLSFLLELPPAASVTLSNQTDQLTLSPLILFDFSAPSDESCCLFPSGNPEVLSSLSSPPTAGYFSFWVLDPFFFSQWAGLYSSMASVYPAFTMTHSCSCLMCPT